MDQNNFRDSSSQMWKCKVPDGVRGSMGSPLGCLQNRLLFIIWVAVGSSSYVSSSLGLILPCIFLSCRARSDLGRSSHMMSKR